MTRNVRGRSWWFECDTWPALPECARLGPFPTPRAVPARADGRSRLVRRPYVGRLLPGVLAVVLRGGADGSPSAVADNLAGAQLNYLAACGYRIVHEREITGGRNG